MIVDGVGAVVTGGASGLGGATAARLASQGARVTIFDSNQELGQRHADAIGGHFEAVDVTDESAVTHALTAVEARYGPSRVLVNCAGIGKPEKMIKNDGTSMLLASFARTIEVNLLGTFNVTAKFVERLSTADLLGEERGVVINTASVAAFDGQIGQAAYSASKGGIVSMTLPLARELARHAIRVTAIAPGLFWTPLLADLPEAALASLGSQVPFPSRLGKPDEYAQLVQSIVENPMLNGETIRLDGAIRMGPR